METIIALTASILTAIQLIPQTIVAIKDKDLSHLSTSTFAMTCTSAFLWILHGSNISDPPIIFANIIIFCCAFTILFMKFQKKSGSSRSSSTSRSPVRRRR